MKSVMGYGYCTFSVRSGFEPNEFIGMLINDNKYPSYDIKFEITHSAHVQQCLREMKDGNVYLDAIKFADNTKGFELKEIQPKSSEYINEFRLFTTDEFINLEIKYRSRSANVLQQVIIKRGKGVCQYAYRIWDFLPSEKWNTPGVDVLIATHNGITNFTPNWNTAFPVPVENRVLRTY